MATIITLMLVGAVLLLLETVLPGLVAGLAGLACLAFATFLAYTEQGREVGNVVLAIVVFGLVLGTFLWIKYFPNSPLARRFISRGTIGNVDAEQPELLDQSGTALTPLRPSGMALINNRRVDVVTEGSMVERGAAIKVIGVEGMRVIVRQATSISPEHEQPTTKPLT